MISRFPTIKDSWAIAGLFHYEVEEAVKEEFDVYIGKAFVRELKKLISGNKGQIGEIKIDFKDHLIEISKGIEVKDNKITFSTQPIQGCQFNAKQIAKLFEYGNEYTPCYGLITGALNNLEKKMNYYWLRFNVR